MSSVSQGMRRQMSTFKHMWETCGTLKLQALMPPHAFRLTDVPQKEDVGRCGFVRGRGSGFGGELTPVRVRLRQRAWTQTSVRLGLQRGLPART